jgi:hypothetical protein
MKAKAYRQGKVWQQERGPRHGNNRKWIARIKKVERKRRRTREKKNLCV